MKAVSGKFHPIFQWFYFDSVESLPENLPLPPEEVDLQVPPLQRWSQTAHEGCCWHPDRHVVDESVIAAGDSRAVWPRLATCVLQWMEQRIAITCCMLVPVLS